ncbi:MAG: PEP-CTERM sorting domain-containing protein [Gemmatimonas sp.]
MIQLTSQVIRHRRATVCLAFASLVSLTPIATHGQVVRQDAGVGTAAAQAARDLFRTDLGGGNIAGANGSFGGVRREINWDGAPAGFSAPNDLPGNFFNVNSPRGVVLSTPGTGFQVSGATGDGGAGQPAAANFGNINASYSAVFSPFSAQRLFTPIASNITDVTFFVAGTNTAGLTRGFGSIFSDVDVLGASTIEFFDGTNSSLLKFIVPSFGGSVVPHFSFLGVSFDTPVVSRVRITTGNAPLSAATNDQNGNPTDLVVMDDFVYGEVVQVVPEPATLSLFALGFVAVVVGARRRSGR